MEPLLTRRARPLLGTIVEIAIVGGNDAAFEAGFAAITHVHRRMSFHDRDSDVSRINTASQSRVVALDPHTIVVLRAALDLHRQSRGLFTLCVGRALVRNGFLPRNGTGHLGQISGMMDDIAIIDETHVRIASPVLIDLGGIAKGYAVDVAVDALIAEGVTSGIVNAGGDLRVFGDVNHPVTLRVGDGTLIGLPALKNTAIASSENTRYRKRRNGIAVTPHVGPDGKSVLIDTLVSVSASTCMIADAMTKVAMSDVALADVILARHAGKVLVAPAMAAA